MAEKAPEFSFVDQVSILQGQLAKNLVELQDQPIKTNDGMLVFAVTAQAWFQCTGYLEMRQMAAQKSMQKIKPMGNG